MDKRKWLWNQNCRDRISCETDSSSDEHLLISTNDPSPNNNTQSSQVVTSKAVVVVADDDEFLDTIKNQHVKLAQQAVAGWEKAENEVTTLKHQLEAALQQNVTLEVRASHLDGALKECVRQLRQSNEDTAKRVSDALLHKTNQWESIKAHLEDKLLQLQVRKDDSMSQYLSPAVAKQGGKLEYPESPHPTIPSIHLKLDALGKENSILKAELLSCSDELEIRTIERDLSTQAAETASKQQLESIRKLVKIEAECRRLQALARKSSNVIDQKSPASSVYVESPTDSQSDSGELLSSLDVDVCKKSKFVQYDMVPCCSDSWASALIAELDQFKNEKATTRNLTACSVEIDIMDDFLEMERLASIPESESRISYTETCDILDTPRTLENAMKAELENTRKRLAELEDKLEKAELEKMTCHTSDLEEKLRKLETENMKLEILISDMSDLRERLRKTEAEKTDLQNMSSHLEEKLEKMEADNTELGSMRFGLTKLKEELVKMEAEKAMLEDALDETQGSLRESKARLEETETRLEELQMELASANETNEMLKFQIIHMEAEARKTAAHTDSLKCLELEVEVNLKSQTSNSRKDANQLKQEDLDVAADKLSECQKTIASLGRQLESLATLEDFLIDTANLHGFSERASVVVSRAPGESCKLHLNNDMWVLSSDSEEIPSGEECLPCS